MKTSNGGLKNKEPHRCSDHFMYPRELIEFFQMGVCFKRADLYMSDWYAKRNQLSPEDYLNDRF